MNWKEFRGVEKGGEGGTEDRGREGVRGVQLRYKCGLL